MGKKQTSENDGGELETLRKELRETQTSLRMLRSIVDSSPAVVCLWRVADDWPVEFISDGISQFGYTPEELRSGKVSYRDFILPEDMVRLEAEVAQYFEQGVDEYAQEYRIITKSGDIRWVEDRNIVIRDSEGRITHIQGIILDITEQRAARIALQQSEEKYRAVVESAGEVVGMIDAEGVFLFSNTTGTERYGKTLKSLVGRTIWDIFPKEFADREAARAREVIVSGKSGTIEVLVPVGDEMRWHEVSMEPVRDHDGKVRSALTIARDIHEHRTADERLRQSELRYRTLFEGAKEGILVADLETRKLMFANPAACRMLKYSAEELLEIGVEVLHRPEDVAHATSEFQALARGDRKTASAVPFRTRDGEVVYADVAATVIRLEGRDCVVGFLRDLTDARQAEEALKTAHMKLMTARDEERKYLASELHDSLSQKLVALGMHLDNVALTGDKLPAEPGYELLKAAVTCNELIADIKGICHGLYPPALEALGLVSAMKQLEGYCRSAGLTAAIRCDTLIARARFKPEVEIALFRIAQEAVNNAIRHSRGANVDIDLTYADGQLVLAVVDDGEGFDAQAVRGAGLGLSSMRDRTRAVGAKLTVDSEPGETRIEVSVAMALEETDGEKGQ